MIIILRSLKYTTITLLMLLLISCNKDKPCQDGELSLNLVGFSTQEIDTLIITKLNRGDLQQPVSIATFVKDVNMTHLINGDTTGVQNLSGFLTQSFDWKVFIPAVNRTINITSIEGERRSVLVGVFETDVMCRNKLFSYLLNGVKITIPDQSGLYGAALYVVK